MRIAGNPSRTPLFRLITIASAGLGGFIVGIWALKAGAGGDVSGMPPEAVGAAVAALCALAAAGAALSFFAGVDESAGYVHQETQVDKLSGFHSRAALIGKITGAVADAARTGTPVFLIDLDIDRFKQINDAIGYAQGDQLIRAFAQRLRTVVPAGAEVGRIGAGEFAILLADDAAGGLDGFMDTLIERMMRPYDLATHYQSVNLSAGVASLPQDGKEAAALLRRSNLALQHARASGVGNWAMFEPCMAREADYRQWIEAELNVALERGDFELHYQPQIDLTRQRVEGYEALIRWNHPQRGLIPPMEFIPIAEETGMIAPIGEWVLRRACSDAHSLPDGCFVAVNISTVQFVTRDFVEVVRAILVETGLDPHRLELEVTETAMMQDREKAAGILRLLSAMGISVAVDDFGTGYSNLSYLIDFPFQKLKIDRSFVSRIDRDNGGAVVSTIVGLARALGVRTVAEGVESEAQAMLLRAAGCDVVQGYLFGRPQRLDACGAAAELRQAAIS